jgi:hypothetical protein
VAGKVRSDSGGEVTHLDVGRVQEVPGTSTTII